MSAHADGRKSAHDEARQRFLALHEGFAAERRGEPGWLASLRARSLEAFRDQGLPHTPSRAAISSTTPFRSSRAASTCS